MNKETRRWIFKTLSDYAESQDLELRDMHSSCIFDETWTFGFYINGEKVHPHYSFEWAKIKESAFSLVCRVIDNFEHNCNLYCVPKKGYTFNNIAAEKRTLKIVNVIFNDPATIVFWDDGTKTVVQTREDDTFDHEKGLAMAISKKMLGNKYEYYNVFKHWLKKVPKTTENCDIEAQWNDFANAEKAVSSLADIAKAFRRNGIHHL